MNVHWRPSDALPEISKRWVPTWLLGWERGGIERQIQIDVYFRGKYPEVAIYTTAWRDDNVNLKRHSHGDKPRRGFRLWLPVEASLLLDTLAIAMSDALWYSEEHLTHSSELSPPWGYGRERPADWPDAH